MNLIGQTFCIVGNDVIFLDPHTTQPSGNVQNKETEQERKLDSTYHCQFASRLHILQLDPSVALVRMKCKYCNIPSRTLFERHLFPQCFLCRSESEFDSLCELIKENLLSSGKQPLFEVCEERRIPWNTAHQFESRSDTNSFSGMCENIARILRTL